MNNEQSRVASRVGINRRADPGSGTGVYFPFDTQGTRCPGHKTLGPHEVASMYHYSRNATQRSDMLSSSVIR